MGKIFAQPAAAAPAAYARFNLFDFTQGVPTLGTGPRDATLDERVRYLDWLAASRGVYVPSDAIYSDAGIQARGADQGVYLVAMPGYGDSGTVTCETLDDAGDVVRTISLPVIRSARGAGSLPMTAAQVQDWTGLEKVRKPRAKKAVPAAAAPVAAPVSAQPQEAAPAPVTASPDVSALLAAVERLTARVVALETAAAGGKRVRTDRERRAIVRAWEMRRTMRERADLDRRALMAANESNRMLLGKLADAERARVDSANLESELRDSQARAMRMVGAAVRQRAAAARLAGELRGSQAEARALMRRLTAAPRARMAGGGLDAAAVLSNLERAASDVHHVGTRRAERPVAKHEYLIGPGGMAALENALDLLRPAGTITNDSGAVAALVA